MVANITNTSAKQSPRETDRELMGKSCRGIRGKASHVTAVFACRR